MGRTVGVEQEECGPPVTLWWRWAELMKEAVYEESRFVQARFHWNTALANIEVQQLMGSILIPSLSNDTKYST